MNDDTRFDTRGAAQYLSSKGIKTSAKTLAKLRSSGTSCPYRKVKSKRVVYDKEALDKYIENILSVPVTSTFEFRNIDDHSNKNS